MSQPYRPIMPAPSSQDPTETGAGSQDFSHTIGSSHKQFQKPKPPMCSFRTKHSRCRSAAKSGSYWCSRHDKDFKGLQQAENGNDASDLKKTLGQKEWESFKKEYTANRSSQQVTARLSAQQAYEAAAEARQQALTDAWNASVGGKIYARRASEPQNPASAWDPQWSSDSYPAQQWYPPQQSDYPYQQSYYQAQQSGSQVQQSGYQAQQSGYQAQQSDYPAQQSDSQNPTS